MPADRDIAAGTGAGVRKPSMNETAGSGRRLCRGRYGDLRAAVGVRDGRREPWVGLPPTLLRMNRLLRA